jgi:iron complex transport system substrate-binding protein
MPAPGARVPRVVRMPGKINLRTLLIAAAFAAVLVLVVALGFVLPGGPEAPRGAELRLVSLMPPVTETLYDIGAGYLLAGRSDYCNYPPEALDLPPCGTALTPNAEAIVGLQPSLILALDAKGADFEQLRALGNTRFLPWLSAQDMIAGTRELGRLTGHEESANRLADELADALVVPEPDGPRVLLVMAHTPGQLGAVTFMRRDSLHGQVLHAAGGRNAADFDVRGVPSLSIERVIELDPEMIIVLGMTELPESTAGRILADWNAVTPLQAVQNARIGLLHGTHLAPGGRRTLQLVDDLRDEIRRLQREP